MKTSASEILDAAERLFAEKGYSATSLGEVADSVGIRSPSLYNHFKNKEALYQAVLERLIDTFNTPLLEMLGKPITKEGILEWLDTIVGLHYSHPNLARLLQHEALAGGPQTSLIIDRMFKPLFLHAVPAPEMKILDGAELEPWAIMALNNIVMSYITMAPMYGGVLGMDLFSDSAIEKQRTLILKLAKMVMDVEE